MAVLTQFSICSSSVNILQNWSFSQKGQTPTSCRCVSGPQLASFRHRDFKLKAFQQKRRFLEVCKRKDLNLVRDGRQTRRRSAVLARFSPGFGLNGGGGGGGGGGKDNSRVLINLALAIGLTYLTLSGQLGWISDTILSIGLVIVPVLIVGSGAFIWWAAKDVVKIPCPSCGQKYATYKRYLLDDKLQLSCPYCDQPFKVIDDKFVKEPVNFKNEFTSKAKSDPRPKMDSSTVIVDVEAEVKDID